MKGFTLIETMVAITILTFAVSGPLFTASRAIVAAQTARDQLTALYLAQEGIEYVRMMRDNEYLTAYHTPNNTDVSGTAWAHFLSSITKCDAKTDPTQACTFDSINGLSFTSCSTGSTGLRCTPLYMTGGMYRQRSEGGQEPFIFTRSIQAVAISVNEEKIISTVSWSFHGTPYSVTVSDHLTSWK